MGKKKGKGGNGAHGRGNKKAGNQDKGHCNGNINQNANTQTNDGKKHSKGGGGYGKGATTTNKFLWKSKSENKGRGVSSGGRTRQPSYIDKLKSGEKTLDNVRDAQQYFKVLSRDYEDTSYLALKFDDDMGPVLEKATNLLHPDMNEPLKLLAAMGGEALTQGVYKERTLRCFRTLYGAADFMLKLTEQLTTGRLQGSKDHSTIAWFILQLGKCGNEDVLNDLLVRDLIAFFKTSNQVGFPQLSKQLDIVFQTVTPNDGTEGVVGADDGDVACMVSLEVAQRAMRPPGVRDHDNDKENFRAISIIPTTQELRCNEGAYLPSTDNSDHMDNKEAAALDRQFRLMREDLLGTVKDELQSEFKLVPSQRRRILPDPCIIDFGMQPEPHVVVRISIPHRLQKRIQGMNNKDAAKFFDDGPGKRVLQRGTLVLIVHDGASAGADFRKTKDLDLQISAVGTVVERRDPLKIVKIPGTDPLKKKRVLEIGISFTPESMRAIAPLVQSLENRNIGVPMVGNGDNGGLFNASAGLFSLEPILKALVRMDQIPMCEQLIYLQKPKVPELAHGGKSFSDLSASLQKTVISDKSQKVAMDEMLKSNTVLIQGPPGTGKTYIGVQMVKAMLEFDKNSQGNKQPLRILCLCYTNHALDSFLLDLIKAGVPKDYFVRLGSSPKIDPKIKSRCLGELEEVKFGKSERAAYGAIKRESETLEIRLKELLQSIAESSTWAKSESWWRKIEEWLEDHYYEELDQLEIPEIVDSDGFRRTVENGKELKRNYLWERWFTGKGRGVFEDKSAEPTGIWLLKKSERKRMITDWNSEWIQPQLDLLESTMKGLQDNAEALRALRQSNDLRVLKSSKIVGCTTVAAARYQGMINPSVVIVEEAGEILESHVLANIGKSCEQLIMIGDHKQLRPKIDNYRLAVESKNGFDLNSSLFERLVVASETEIPVIPLTIQHRMRPEISRIIRDMGLYGELIDHENTKGRRHVSGVANDVVFITHQHAEKLDETTAALGMATKVNVYEVDMVVRIAKYIIQQGQYPLDQVTILTPYLGQLSLIRKKLEESQIGSFVNDQDFSDLARLDLNEGSTGQGDKKIRLATVDNFQGEESDVVIVSLVRSNPRDGRIGFLTSEERINVLFSRAREGMYIVGNLDSLAECASKSGRELWSNLKLSFERHHQCLDYFPAQCQSHQTLQIVKTPDDFAQMVPEGGCSERCTLMLECGHQCPKKCHGHIKHVHSLVKCKEQVEDICSNGHTQLRMCSSTVKCSKAMKWFCPRGHAMVGTCRYGRPKICGTCEALDQFEEEARERELQQEKEILQQELRLLESKSKLSSQIKHLAIVSKRKMLEREQMLVNKHLSKTLVISKSENSDSQSETNSSCSDVDVDNLCTVDDFKDSTSMCIGDTNSDHSGNQLEEITGASKVSGDISSNDGHVTDLATEYTQHSDSPRPRSPERNSDIKEKDVDDHSRGIQNHRTNGLTSKSGAKDSSVTAQVLQKADACSLLRNADFCDALKRFQAKEFLEADDLVDNCFGIKQTTVNKKTLQAFRYIIHESLDPSSGDKWEETKLKMKPLKSFEEALQCWASFVSLASTDEFPFIAKEYAQLFLGYKSRIADAENALNVGRERASFVIQQAQKYKNNPTQSRSEKEVELESIQKDWKAICRQDKDAPGIMTDEIMKMTGLCEIKRSLIDQYLRIRVSQRQGDAAASSYNVRFEGNPGTGKTTIARHYSKFLQQLNVLPTESITLDVTAAALINKGVSYLEDMLEKVKTAGGGVIFIDEAYQLANDKAGERLLDFIMPVSDALEGDYGKLVWIFAGYRKEMEKLFEHNVGLPSRFPQMFTFTDYTASEMHSIFDGLMKFKDKAKETEVKKNTGPPAGIRPIPASSRNINRTAYRSRNGETYEDRFRNKWTCDSNEGLWKDDHDNSTGYHPENIGSAENPLASYDGQLWTNDGKLWISNNNVNQVHYPGTPELVVEPNGKRVLRNPRFVCTDDKYLRIAVRRLERQSNRPGFGNARTVRTFFDSTRERQARRIAKENSRGHSTNDFLFTKDDLLGVALKESQIKKGDAYKKLQSMEGLKPVKEQIDLLIQLGTSNLKREEAEQPLLEVMLNRVFLGNPGTGKTTVAKIYGQLLTEMGLLSKGEVIVKNPSDFKGAVLGSSEKSTRNILRAAEGNVLVIDEAYALCTSNGLNGSSDPYGTAVIDTLVEQIQARPGDDRAVVMLGYRKEMELMFKNVNPGLSRRFQLEQAYEFPDYDDASLLKILRKKARDSQLSMSIQVAKLAVRSLARARAKPNFGNGGAIDSILSLAKERMQKRDGTSTELVMEDFAVDNEGMDETALDDLFADMIGMDNVINKLNELKRIVKFAKARGENPADCISFNYLFLGNPGTGKTTVARLMGKMFKMLGLLPDDEVFECTPKDLVTGFVGQAGLKTAEKLEQSRGGVLFIDEAYQLNPQRGGSYMTEVVDELCAKLTDVEFKGKILVLLAGYDGDMDEMLQVNPGLKSRFAERIGFEDLSDEATRDLIALKLTKKNIPLTIQDAQSCSEFLSISRQLAQSKDFANGRDVDTICDRAYSELAKRTSKRSATVSLDDVRNAVQTLIASRNPQKNSKACNKLLLPDDSQQNASSTLSGSAPVTTTATDDAVEGDEEKEQEEIQDDEKEDLDDNPFGDLNADNIAKLQDIIEKMGLNSEEGIQTLLSSNDKDKVLIQQLMSHLGISEDTARDFLEDWRKAHGKAKEQKRKAKAKFKGMEAIWHCAVCGRGGHPAPVCYVAPYISGYRPMTVRYDLK